MRYRCKSGCGQRSEEQGMRWEMWRPHLLITRLARPGNFSPLIHEAWDFRPENRAWGLGALTLDGKLSAPFPNLINGIWFRPISGPEFQGGAKNGERVRLTKLAFVLLPCIAYLYCCPALLITFGTFYWQKQKDPFAVGIQRRSLTSGFAVCVHPIIRIEQVSTYY